MIIDTANGSSFLIGNNIFNTMYIEGGIIGFSGMLDHHSVHAQVAAVRERSSHRREHPAHGFVTALQGASG